MRFNYPNLAYHAQKAWLQKSSFYTGFTLGPSAVPQSKNTALVGGEGGGALVGEGDDDLAGAGVVELFAGLVLDGAGIGLEPGDMDAETVVLFGEFVDLAGEGGGVGALALVDGEAVLAEDDVVRKAYCEQGGGDGCGSAAVVIDAAERSGGGASCGVELLCSAAHIR